VVARSGAGGRHRQCTNDDAPTGAVPGTSRLEG
jgi:hypothetical protein